MTTLTEQARTRRPLSQVLIAELARREGRWGAVSRIATCCTLTVAIAMVFRMPQPTYMAYIVFAVSKDEKSSTVTAGAGALISVTLGIAITLCLSLIDTAEPALRLPLMALATFIGMFTVRTFALGPVSYLAGFVIVLLQSVVDDVRDTESLTRAILWIWVVVVVPVVITVVVSLLYGQGVAVVMRRTTGKVLRDLEATLGSGDFRMHLPEWRAQILPLAGTAEHAPALTAPAIAELLDALVILEAFPTGLSDEVTAQLIRDIRACRTEVESQHSENQGSAVDEIGYVRPPGERDTAVEAFQAALIRLAHPQPAPAHQSSTAGSPKTKQLFVGDAFTNPAHWQFAFKTTLAVMVTYAVYTLLDWPGLRTCIVTCFFVALSSLGETIHKLLLRLSGAVIGGLVSGLCIVFLLPHLTDVGELCLLIGMVSLGAAWVATSSELLAYAGMQMAFAFFLGVLQGYAPANDLTVLRDRLAGILLGNLAITLVFSSVWPESARSGLRSAITDALQAIAEILRQPFNDGSRLRTAQALVRADHFDALSAYELQMLPAASGEALVPLFSGVERLAGSAFAMTYAARKGASTAGPPGVSERWAESAADRLSALALTTTSNGMARDRTLEQLDAEVRNVAATLH